MTTKLAYLGVIIIWATTPLAIKWSTEDVGYLFGIAGRMLLGLVVTYVIILVLRLRMSWDRRSCQAYLAGGLGIYSGMGCVYWGAQYIPSGWVSVVFGLSPIITGAMAAVLLKEDALTVHKLLGMILGFAGLVIVFGHGAALGSEFMYGVLACLLGTFWHGLSAVTIKRLNTNQGGFALTAGSLSFAVPLLLVTWWAVDGSIPATIPLRAGLSIVYLGIVASAIGFALYFYILKRMAVSRVSLIALITPVIALGLGNLLNGEPLSRAIVTGTACIIAGLCVYEFGQHVVARLTPTPRITPTVRPNPD